MSYEQAALLRVVEVALRDLPPAQRAALLLREVHGLPPGEVAYAMGTTTESAAVTLTRARKTFRRTFLAAQATDGVAPDVAVQGAGAMALGLWLPRLHLPRVPLPAGLDNPTLLTAASTSATMSAGHADATIGFMAHLADLLSTKAGAAAASATVLTGSIGGAYAAEHVATHATPVAPAVRTAATHRATRAVAGTSGHTPGSADGHAAATPAPDVSVAAAPAPTPSATATSPAPQPSDSATPITLGEGRFAHAAAQRHGGAHGDAHAHTQRLALSATVAQRFTVGVGVGLPYSLRIGRAMARPSPADPPRPPLTAVARPCRVSAPRGASAPPPQRRHEALPLSMKPCSLSEA